VRTVSSVLIGLGIATVAAAGAHAQTASELLDQGIAAYEEFDFPAAARLFERALAFEPPRALEREQRLRAFTYLGAAEHFGQNPTAAVRRFRSAVLLDTRYRPDSLQFPPEIIRLYSEALQTTKAVTVSVEPLSAFVAGQDGMSLTIVPSSFHEVTVTIARANGTQPVQLYEGPIRQALTMRWDGYGADGRPVRSGEYRLEVASRVTSDQVLRSVRIPLNVSVTPVDTLPHNPTPPDSLLAPERGEGHRQVGPLLGGIGLGAWAVLVPTLAGGDEPSGGRFLVGAALSAASIAGFFQSGRGAPIPSNVAANERLRAQWHERSARAAAENAERRQGVQVVVRAGAAENVEGSR